VCSWSDFFHTAADAWRDEAWDIIRRTPHLTYLLLTKRSKNIRDRLPTDWVYHNVHLGVTVESNKYRYRIDDLLEIPAISRFISVEPMLGEVDIQEYLVHNLISQVICGGESGPKARPLHPDWVRSLRDQCILAGIPYFFKQWGEWFPVTRDVHFRSRMKDEPQWHIWPDEGFESTVSRRVGKKKAGCILDGQVWNQMPA
jgi:protein gp37